MSKKLQSLSVSSCNAVRNSAAKVLRVEEEEGDISNSVKSDLQARLGDNPDDYTWICSTACCQTLDYCQSKLAALPASLISSSQDGSPDNARLPRRWGSINHDFIVLHMTGRDSKGKEHKFSIVAEKGGAGQAEGFPGIQLGLLREADLQSLQNNIFKSWNCRATQVPLEIVTRTLWKDQSPDYHLIGKNCWDYAREACKKFFLLLSELPSVDPDRKLYFKEKAEEVEGSVVLKAMVETSGRAAMYVGFAGLSVAGAVIAYHGLHSLIGADESTDSDED